MTSTFGTAAAQLVPLAVKDLDENKVTPGLLGFVIFAFIGLALWWLMKNMAKQFKKIDFDETPPEEPQAPAAPPATAGAPASGSGKAEREE
ncbi:hypothetical protein [Streptomyces sp. NBC_01537]|uniref:hypothetical protein n=1 Tax=Streptomyces sp. NBC_01537 TaxID=2903896 RepID=UPI00386A84E5